MKRTAALGRIDPIDIAEVERVSTSSVFDELAQDIMATSPRGGEFAHIDAPSLRALRPTSPSATCRSPRRGHGHCDCGWLVGPRRKRWYTEPPDGSRAAVRNMEARRRRAQRYVAAEHEGGTASGRLELSEHLGLLHHERSVRVSERRCAAAVRIVVRQHRYGCDLVCVFDATRLRAYEPPCVQWDVDVLGRRHRQRPAVLVTTTDGGHLVCDRSVACWSGSPRHIVLSLDGVLRRSRRLERISANRDH